MSEESVVLLTGCQNSLENAVIHAIGANGVTHTSPGRQPWVEGQKTKASAESAIHWASEAGRWPAKKSTYKPTQGFALGWYEPGLRPEGNRGYEIASMSAVKDVGNDKG